MMKKVFYFISGLLIINVGGNAAVENMYCYEHYINASVKIMDINVDEDGFIYWKTIEEGEKTPFTIQQFKWGQWISIKKVEGKGGNDVNEYKESVLLTSGENKFRIIRYNMWQSPSISDDFVLKSNKAEIATSFDKNSKTLQFNRKTAYIIKDINGQNIEEGIGNSVNLSNLESGKYLIGYDNTFTEISI